MFEEYLKHLRQEPIDHRLTVKTECGVRRSFSDHGQNRADRLHSMPAGGGGPTHRSNPKAANGNANRKGAGNVRHRGGSLLRRIRDHLTEHGEDFTGWQHRDIFTRSNRMSRAGAISLFHQLDYDRLMIVTVFRDRSWIVQYEPTTAPPAHPWEPGRTNTASLDLIHQALDTSLERLAKQTWMDIVAVLAQAKQMSRLEPKPKPEPKLKPRNSSRVRTRPGSNGDATDPTGKTGVTLEVAIMNYRIFPDRAKARLPAARLQGSGPEWVVRVATKCGRRRDVVRDRTALHAERRARRHRDVHQEIPEEPEKKEQQ